MPKITLLIPLMVTVSLCRIVDAGEEALSKKTDSNPVAKLSAWLKLPAGGRPSLTEQPFSKTGLSKTDCENATKLLLEDFQNRIQKNRSAEWKAKSIKLEKLEMKFDYRVFGKKPADGRSLFISMHGGGGAPARVNDQQWKNQIRLYEPEEGVYLAPRAPTNTWNLWHQGHIDDFFTRIIENAIVLEGVNPNRVYIMGYSAGGDGVYQLAPRMADQIAAAAMMAGHPNGVSPIGLRNIGFALYMGGKDGAYNRNKIAAQWKVKLAELQKNDPTGYRHVVKIYPQFGHWMNREDKIAVPWMAKFTRDPNPTKIVWKQTGKIHNRFYWLSVDEKNRIGGSEVIATRDGQNFKIESASSISSINLRLNDQLANLDQPITITAPDGTQSKVEAKRTIATLYQSLSERVDPSAIYSFETVVDVKQQ
ncbi:hypothetical protein OAF56_01315 [Pirellulaceae bacterium]|nr:hypothetical protein [Pirellulaceae bacterium]